MFTDQYFDSIRPYRDNEMRAVFEQLMKEDAFIELLGFLFPDIPIQGFVDKLLSLEKIGQFQIEVIYPFIKRIIKETTQGVTCEGLDKLSPDKSYVFISNHRDIVLDSAFLNILLHDNGHDTCEIAIGDNLLIYPWITKLVRLNKSFQVKRNLPVRQMLEASKMLSQYIRYDLTTRNSSVWIAQREGRSKNGDDRTQTSLLKMLNLSGEKDFESNFKELQIVPLSISYEYDPCDYLKAHEFLMKRDNPSYKKTQADDLKHMGAGIKGRKGRVHFNASSPIDAELLGLNDLSKNDQLEKLAEIIDEKIHNNYKLWPGNFIASDLISNTNTYQGYYTKEDEEKFHHYMDEHISRLNTDPDFIRHSLCEMYANPVKNFFNK